MRKRDGKWGGARVCALGLVASTLLLLGSRTSSAQGIASFVVVGGNTAWNKRIMRGGTRRVEVNAHGIDFATSVQTSTPRLEATITGRKNGAQNGGMGQITLRIHAKDNAALGVHTVTINVGPNVHYSLFGPSRESFTVRVVEPPPPPFDRFESNRTTFSWRNAALLVAACSLADKGTATRRDALKAYGFDEATVHPFQETGPASGYLCARADLVLLVFRGTDPLNAASWIGNIDGALIPTTTSNLYCKAEGAALHRGYVQTSNSLWTEGEIAAYLNGPHGKKPDGSRKGIWIAGHSQGAAIAALIASRLDLSSPSYPVKGVYLFAPPSPGNQGFSTDYNQRLGARTFRFINLHDSVPRLPSALLGWKSVGTTLYWLDLSRIARLKADDDGAMVGGYAAAAANPVHWLPAATPNIGLALKYHGLEEQYWRWIQFNATLNGVLDQELPAHPVWPN